MQRGTHASLLDKRHSISSNLQLLLEDTRFTNNKWLSLAIEQVSEELNEIMRSKVAAIGGNCIQGYKIDFITLTEEPTYQGQAILLAMAAIGDGLELSDSSQTAADDNGAHDDDDSSQKESQN